MEVKHPSMKPQNQNKNIYDQQESSRVIRKQLANTSAHPLLGASQHDNQFEDFVDAYVVRFPTAQGQQERAQELDGARLCRSCPLGLLQY